MRRAFPLLLLAFACTTVQPDAQDAQDAQDALDSPADTAGIAATLDAFHGAASRADGEAYFPLLTADAIFIGTDPAERWSVAELRAFAEPYFSRGKGWTYVPRNRHITVGASGRTAWFDEMLDNASYGVCRGTGVLVREGGRWKIAQYHLTIPIPNELAKDVVGMIRARG